MWHGMMLKYCRKDRHEKHNVELMSDVLDEDLELTYLHRVYTKTLHIIPVWSQKSAVPRCYYIFKTASLKPRCILA